MKRTFLIHGRIIDSIRDSAIEDGILVFERYHIDPIPNDDKIVYVGDFSDYSDYEKDVRDGDVVVDMSGYTLMPGLFNVHAHLGLAMPYKSYRFDEMGVPYRSMVMLRRAAEALECGVTTVRSTGGPDNIDYAIRDIVDKGMIMASRIVPCGALNIATGGHAWNNYISAQFNGVDEFSAAVRTELSNGAAFIKIGLTGGAASAHEGMADKQMTDDEIRAVVEIAHNAGKKVAAHLGGNKPIRDAIRLGIDSIEHAYSMTEETAELMKENDCFLVPTLTVTNCNDYLIGHGSPEFQVNKLQSSSEEHLASISRAINVGVKICTGTDLLPSDPIAGTNATVREMELLVKAGMTPMQAIKAATINSAELCDLNHIVGTLEAGKQGDFIAVKGCPDKDISDMRNLGMVVKSCRLMWSTLEGLKIRRYHVTAPGVEVAGGTYMKW